MSKNTAEIHELWQEFLKDWPVERVRGMKLEEYTNNERRDAFIY